MLDVVIFCEGTYPYVSGGVSSWINSLLQGMPELTFGLVYLAPTRHFERKFKYKVPDCVKEIQEVYLYDVASLQQVGEGDKAQAWKAAEQFFTGMVEGHLPDFDKIFRYLTPLDERPAVLSAEELAYSKEAWDIMLKIYQRHAADVSFVDFFWTWRFINFPLFQLLQVPIPQARMYHTVTTGWSGLMGVLAKMRTGRPLILTEHGIYTHERRIEIMKADWIHVEAMRSGEEDFGLLKSMWINLFTSLSRLCYDWADEIYTLSEVNRRMELAAGAQADKIQIVPNGVALDRFRQPEQPARKSEEFAIGFVGRVVPIKDLKTFLLACRLVTAQEPAARAYIIGPTDEDPEYYEECRALHETLKLGDKVVFLGPQDMQEWYPRLDCIVLTSISEGQPLVILEAFAYGIPVVTTDVGACSELIYGREASDQALGAAGFLTQVGVPGQTANSILQLIRQPELGRRQGRAAQERVRRYYDFKVMLARYRDIYNRAMAAQEMVV